MRTRGFEEHHTRTAVVSVWRAAGRISIVQCRAPEIWAMVRRWKFSKPYAETYQQGVLTERAFAIPTKKEAFARRALGLPAVTRAATPAQAAYYARLRGSAFGKATKRSESPDSERLGRLLTAEIGRSIADAGQCAS